MAFMNSRCSDGTATKGLMMDSYDVLPVTLILAGQYRFYRLE
jgi:hypothetical protein